MKKLMQWILIVAGGLAVVIIVALLVIPLFVNLDKYKPEIEKFVSQSTQRSFSMGNELKLTLFPWAGFSLSDLQLGNPIGFSEKQFVTVKAFEIRVKLLPLIFKDIRIKRFVMEQPRIVLVKNKNGRGNWTQPGKIGGAAPSEGGGPASGSALPIKALSVGNFSIKDGTLLWIDHAAGTRQEITDLNLTLQDVSLTRPIGVAFSARLNGQPVMLDGALGPVGKDLSRGKIPLDLTVTLAEQLKLHLQGTVENPAASPAANLAVAVAEFSPRKLLAALKQPFPIATADPKALDKVALKARIKGSPQALAISNGVLQLDASRLDFSLQAKEFSRPDVTFDLALDMIDLDRYLPAPEQKPATRQKTAETAAGPRKKTDYSPLRRLVADGRVKIGKLIVKKLKLQDFFLRIRAKNGIIRLDPLKLALYQGHAAGKTILNVKKDIPTSNLNFQVNSVRIGPLLRDMLDKDFLEGAASAGFSLAMTGDDAAMIKKTLNGKGQLLFKDGAIKGIDLASMARNVKAAFNLAEKPSAQRPRTDFAELRAPFNIRNGRVHTPGSILKSPFIRVVASGDADLVKESLDFYVKPKVVSTIVGQGDTRQRGGIMVPIKVTGSFAAPKFAPDLKAIASQQFQKQVLESKQLKKALPEKELKSLEKTSKGLLNQILNQ